MGVHRGITVTRGTRSVSDLCILTCFHGAKRPNGAAQPILIRLRATRLAAIIASQVEIPYQIKT